MNNQSCNIPRFLILPRGNDVFTYRVILHESLTTDRTGFVGSSDFLADLNLCLELIGRFNNAILSSVRFINEVSITREYIGDLISNSKLNDEMYFDYTIRVCDKSRTVTIEKSNSEVVPEKNSADHTSPYENFQNTEQIPNATNHAQEDIANENPFEDLHSDPSDDWSGMDSFYDQTHRPIPSSDSDYVVSAESSTATACSSKDFYNNSDGTLEGKMRPVRVHQNKIDQNIRFEDSWENMISSSEEYDGKYIQVTEMKPEEEDDAGYLRRITAEGVPEPDALSNIRSHRRAHISWIKLMKKKEEEDKHIDWSEATKECRDYDWRIFLNSGANRKVEQLQRFDFDWKILYGDSDMQEAEEAEVEEAEKSLSAKNDKSDDSEESPVRKQL
ncbi:hypothetical protein ACOME3_004529 [Neoechinorhynchus agilis]